MSDATIKYSISEFECVVCTMTKLDFVVCSVCNKIICKDCIEELEKIEAQKDRCPYHSKGENEEHFIYKNDPERKGILEALLKKQKMQKDEKRKCDRCLQEFTFEQFREHKKKCYFKCKFCQGIFGKKEVFFKHFDEDSRKKEKKEILCFFNIKKKEDNEDNKSQNSDGSFDDEKYDGDYVSKEDIHSFVNEFKDKGKLNTISKSTKNIKTTSINQMDSPNKKLGFVRRNSQGGNDNVSSKYGRRNSAENLKNIIDLTKVSAECKNLINNSAAPMRYITYISTYNFDVKKREEYKNKGLQYNIALDLFYCGQPNQVPDKVFKTCEEGGLPCINCMNANKDYHSVAKHHLINRAGRDCSYGKSIVYCGCQYILRTLDKDNNYYKKNAVCGDQAQCDSCKEIQPYLEFYLGIELYQKLLKRDQKTNNLSQSAAK